MFVLPQCGRLGSDDDIVGAATVDAAAVFIVIAEVLAKNTR